jgi:iron complex outermembrane receptor protein
VLNLTNGNIDGNSWAVFAQGNWRFAPRWVLTAGARYTSENKSLVSFNQKDVNGAILSCSVPADLLAVPGVCQSRPLANTFNQPTWTASLTYDVFDNVSAYVKASHGFRGGGENYRGAKTDFSFQSFLPETVNEYEIGVKSEFFDRRVRLNLAGFHDDMSNLQRSVIIGVTIGGSTQTATVVTNAASARIDGVEAEGVWRVTHELTLSGSLGVIDPKYIKFVDFTGDRSGEAWPTPKVTYDLSATYVQPTSVGDLTGTVTWTGQSAQDMSPASKQAYQVTQPAYGLLNGRLSLDIPSFDASVSLFARNMLGKHYIVSAVGLEALGWNTIIEGEPRTFGIEAVKRFGGI